MFYNIVFKHCFTTLLFSINRLLWFLTFNNVDFAMKISNLLIYGVFIICLLLALLDKAIDNNTYFMCISIMISTYIIGTEIENKNYEKDKSK